MNCSKPHVGSLTGLSLCRYTQSTDWHCRSHTATQKVMWQQVEHSHRVAHTQRPCSDGPVL